MRRLVEWHCPGEATVCVVFGSFMLAVAGWDLLSSLRPSAALDIAVAIFLWMHAVMLKAAVGRAARIQISVGYAVAVGMTWWLVG
jgi:hypothetical protein